MRDLLTLLQMWFSPATASPVAGVAFGKAGLDVCRMGEFRYHRSSSPNLYTSTLCRQLINSVLLTPFYQLRLHIEFLLRKKCPHINFYLIIHFSFLPFSSILSQNEILQAILWLRTFEFLFFFPILFQSQFLFGSKFVLTLPTYPTDRCYQNFPEIDRRRWLIFLRWWLRTWILISWEH